MRSPLGWSFVSLALALSGASCANPPEPEGFEAYNPDNSTGTRDAGQGTGAGNPNPGMDAASMPPGAKKDAGAQDAGPQCNVPSNAPRGFHCTYVNRIASGILAPPDSGLPQIKGCKDFPPEVSRADVQKACDKIFPALEGSVMVASGPCDTKDAVGYCSDTFGGRDFAYHADCNIMNSSGGSGSWACDKVVPDEAGWVCLQDPTRTWARNCGEDVNGDAGLDAGTPSGGACEAPSGGDGKTYRCNYTNKLASDAVKHDVLGCKEYRGTWTAAAAESDCKALLQADKGKTISFAEGSCATAGMNGYCFNGRADREYSYEGGCNAAAQTSGAWACSNFGVGGQEASCAKWKCEGQQPDRKCTIAAPVDGAPSCHGFAFNTSAADATAYCQPKGGAVSEGYCATTGAVATCTGADGSVDVYTKGVCVALQKSCTGTFACLKDPDIWSCKVKDTGFGCSLLPGSYDCDYCVDYSEVGGWSEATAKSACEKLQTNASYRTFTKSNACAEAGYKDRCVNTDGTRGYGDGQVGTDCKGKIEAVPPLVCDDKGVLTCRYSSTFTANNCADFPTKECWTEADVAAHCKAQQGAQANSVVVTTNNTCLAQTPTADRCAAETAGKSWYAYGTPENICTGFIDNGKFQKAPYPAY